MSIRVVVIDDTPTTRQLLVHIINHSGDMLVVGEGSNGEQAMTLAQQLLPDVILMDIVMPRMDGLEATRQIMRQTPVPIVLITATLRLEETDVAFQALQAGALTVLQKPSVLAPAEITQVRNTVRAMSQVKVIHHFGARPSRRQSTMTTTPRTQPPEIVAIASSTGGPAALGRILNELPATFPLPIVIVQHISADFVDSLAAWLNQVTPLTVKVAQEDETPQAGYVYLSPGDAHLSLRSNGRLHLDSDLGTWRYMPSCDVLLHSVAQVYPGRSIGVVLTGMGDDGADGLRAMYDTGAITIAQDEGTSIVYGMPHEAVQRGGVQHVISLVDMASRLVHLAMKTEEGEPT